VKRKIFPALLLILLSSCSGRYILHSSFDASPVPPTPDYSNENYWAALPWKKNFSDSVPGEIDPVKIDSPGVDVFFIHPTTFTHKPKTAYKWNADVNDPKLNRKVDEGTILYQASVFNRSCNIYAPRYRQAHISAFYSDNANDSRKALDTAYDDVKHAFEYYLEHYNHGKPFIIASHSQGTVHAKHLMKDFLSDSTIQKKLVAAYLIGYSVNPDSFEFIKPCQTPDQTDCYCTWNTYARNYYPDYYQQSLKNAVCTNPLSWKTDTLYCTDSLNLGGVLLNFKKVVPEICDAQVHDGMLWIDKPKIPFASLLHIKVYHEGDINLFYFNIQQNVADRIKAYKKNLK